MKIISAVEYDTPELIVFANILYIYDSVKKHFVRGISQSSYVSDIIADKFAVVTAKLSDCETICITSTEWLGYAVIKTIRGKLDSCWENNEPIKHYEFVAGFADLDKIHSQLVENSVLFGYLNLNQLRLNCRMILS